MTQTLSKILYVEDEDDHIKVMVGRDVIYDCHSVVALQILIRDPIKLTHGQNTGKMSYPSMPNLMPSKTGAKASCGFPIRSLDLIVDDDPFHRSLERVSGTWKYLTGNVYMVTSNLTNQVCHTQSVSIAALRI